MRLLIATLPILALSTFVVPPPEGPYGVSIQDVVLVDDSLADPYLNRSTRRVAASIIAATGLKSSCCPTQQPYLPAKAAAFWEQSLGQAFGINLNHTLIETTLDLCEPCTNSTAPVILFAPGAAIARQLYHIPMSHLVAKSGYTVITFEQPGYVQYEEFPDGSIEPQQRKFPAGGLIDTLVQDVQFILDHFQPQRAAMMGHSEGGGLTGAAVVADARLLGGIDLDGGFYNSSTSLLTHTTETPFALSAHEGHYQNNSETPWVQIWQNLRGDKWQLELNGSQHTTFSDAPYLIRDLSQLDKAAGANSTIIDAVVGTIPGRVAIWSISAMAKAFFEYCFGQADAGSVVEAAGRIECFSVQNVTVLPSYQK